MTLDEMIQQCASDIDEILSKTNGVYVGKALVLANKIVTGINYAYLKIAREKHVLTQEETVALGDGGAFSTGALSKPLVRLFNVYDGEQESVFWVFRNQLTIVCPDNTKGEQMTVEYSWLPDRLVISNLSGEPLLPETQVDHLLLCYYADYYVLSLEPDNETREKAATFLGLFNDGFENIQQKIHSNLSMRVE